MAKKVITPDEYKAKTDKKADKRKRFGKTFLTTFAYALACVVVFSAMAIAFTPNTVVVSGGAAPVNSNSGSSNSGSSNGGSNNETPPAETPGAEDGNNGGAAQAPEQKPGDADATKDEKAEAVDLYKKAVSKAKSSAKKITHTKTSASNYNGIVEAGKLSDVAKSLMDMFMKASEPNEEVSKADMPPKSGANALTTASVKSASVKEEGKYQVVTIEMKNQSNPAFGKDGIGSVVNIIEESQITGAIGSFPLLKLSNINIAYENVKVVAKIEKDTGNLVQVNSTVPCILSLDAKMGTISLDNAKVGILSEDEYVFAW